MAVADDHDETPDGEATLEALVAREARMAIIAVGPEGRVAYANPGVREVLGFEADELLHANLLDYLHPDDVERAVLSMTWRDTEGQPPPGFTDFRARHKTRGYVEVETTASHLVYEGRDHLAIYVRPAPPQTGEQVLALVASGAPRAEALTAALGSVDHEAHRAQMAIAWPEGSETHQVNTGLPEALTGLETGGTGNPWSACLKTRRSVRRSVAELDDATAALAGEVGLAEVWVEPVFWSDVEPQALVTLWAPGGLGLPEIHGWGMEMACRLVQLVLRFTAHTRLQEELANHDGLTGLVNRRAFLEHLAAASGGGVVLYCDLDHFKPVNDELGHAAGDQLLCAVAQRMVDCLRTTDLVARMGGDEFAILCDNATEESAMMIARRVIAAIAQPFDLDGRAVTLGVTIGAAHAGGPMTEEVLARADRALRAAKVSRSSAVLADWETPAD